MYTRRGIKETYRGRPVAQPGRDNGYYLPSEWNVYFSPSYFSNRP
jgi:hypothetical protein